LGRFNLPVYFTHISLPQGGGHEITACLTGDNPLNFYDWNFIEPQNDGTNIKPGVWNMPYDSRVYIYIARDFKCPPYEDRIRGSPAAIFYIDTNGNDSLVYINPDLFQVRPPIPKDVSKEMNEDESYEIPFRDLMYHPRDSLEYRIISGDNVTAEFTDSSLIIQPEENYHGSVDISWEYLGKFTQNQMNDSNPENAYRDTGFVKLDIQCTNAIADNSSLPKDYSLNQNYPNPFNSSTIISYSIPKREHVSLNVYDIKGRKLETLVNKTQPAGSYEVNFDASNYTSGVYLYQLKAGEFVETGKMLLLK